MSAGVSFDGEAIQDAEGLEIPFAQYAFSVGADNAPIEFELRPILERWSERLGDAVSALRNGEA